jgi:hypothetical protein
MCSEPKKIQSKQLKDFQTKKEPLAGNTSGVYYRASVFFEKLRIRDGIPKTKFRWEPKIRGRITGASIGHEGTHTCVV